MSFDYDITIRTVGGGGEKYAALLDSIKALETKPRAVYIILPEGGTPPEQRLGGEIFVYAKKGMITQRVAALDCCTSEFILFCDDDIRFAPDFVKKLHRAVTSDGFDIATGEVLAFLPPKTGIKNFIPAVQAAAVPTLFHRDRYVTILRSSGWSYNRFKPEEGVSLPTQSAAGCMFFMRRSDYERLRLRDELWAQHGALAPADDQIMFYKADRIGLKVCVATDAHYDHLSARSATSSEKSKKEKSYWSGFNRVVFWRRYIYDAQSNTAGRLFSSFAFGYYRAATAVHLRLRKLLKPVEGAYGTMQLEGFRDGLRFIKTKEYVDLPKLVKLQESGTTDK